MATGPRGGHTAGKGLGPAGVTGGGAGARGLRSRTRSWRLLLIAVLVLVLLLLPVAARRLYPQMYPQPPLAALDCGPRKATSPMAIDLVDDRSGSTYATDPRRRREQELQTIVRWVAGGTCHPDDTISVQHFDDVVAAIGPRRVGRAPADVDAVTAALPVDAPESSSALAPSVSRASGWASTSPRATRILVIATDGMLSDTDEAFAALRAYPGRVHLLVLGGRLPGEWDGLDRPFTSTSLTDRLRFGDVAVDVARVVRATNEARGASAAEATP